MKVFFTKPTACYCGGMVLVAANTSDEALNVAAKEDSSAFSEYDYDTREYRITYDTYYEWSPFEEVVGLSFGTTEPQIILSNYYAE